MQTAYDRAQKRQEQNGHEEAFGSPLDRLIRKHLAIDPEDKAAVKVAYEWLTSEPEELFRLLAELDTRECKIRIGSIAGKFKNFYDEKKIHSFIMRRVMDLWDSAAGEDGTKKNSFERSKDAIRKTEERHAIFVVKGELHKNAAEAERVLVDSGCPIYQWADGLYTPKDGSGKDGSGNEIPILQMARMTPAGLRTVLSEKTAWFEPAKPSKDFPDKFWRPIDVPNDIVAILLAPDRRWTYPYCAGILKMPVIKSDGTMIIKPGYDATTGFYLYDSGYGAIDVKEAPTREDAEQALQLLKSTHSGIPLIDYHEDGTVVPHNFNKPSRSRSVLLAAQMAPMVLCRKKPATCVEAPEYGSGKSYCCDICAQMPLGTNAPVSLFSKNGEELVKTLDADLLKGSQFICLDNAEGLLKNTRLTQIIERELINIRILGRSQDVVVPFENGVVMINGNNIRIAADLVRRVLHVHLDAMMENPETRIFSVDQREAIRMERGKFISAVLTIIKAFLLAGEQHRMKSRAMSYETWSDTIRSTLVWLGEADPWLSSQEYKPDDPERELISDLFDGFWRVPNSRLLSAG